MRITIEASVLENSLKKAEEQLSFLKNVLKEPYPIEIATQIAEIEGQIYILVKVLNSAIKEVPDKEKK